MEARTGHTNNRHGCNNWKIVAIFNVEAMFAYHHINAYEEDGNIVMDLAAFPNGDHIHTFDTDLLRKNQPNAHPCSNIKRVTLQLQNCLGKDGCSLVKTAIIKPNTCLDLVAINPAFYQKKHRYVYGVAQHSPGDMYNVLVKVDTEGVQSVRRWGQDDYYPGEPQYVARPGAISEDDGVILSIVLSGADAQSFLLVLDAETFVELAKVWLPDRTTYLSHGLFIPSSCAGELPNQQSVSSIFEHPICQ